MKRRILVLTLTLLLSSAAPAQAASGGDPANAQIPTSTTRSMTEAESAQVKIYIEDTPSVAMNATAVIISLVALLY